jgi:predicted AlkP superfamily pyrophosphatase or phosphodiesterase
MKKTILHFTIAVLSIASSLALAEQATPPSNAKHIILFIWDGLRPDAVSQEKTPNLYAFMKSGVEFSDNHSTYPTFTMMNAASFATGDRAGNTGFYGNTLWHPGIKGNDSAGAAVNFAKPIFTEDYKILQDLNQDSLFFVPTLFSVAHKQHLNTAVIGKTGPAFMQDYLSQGTVLDEKHVYPLHFAKELQQSGYVLPKNSPLRFETGELVLSEKNGNPTAATQIYYFNDEVTSNPNDQHGSPYSTANRYMMKVYLNEILSKQSPQLSVIWMRNPDTTEHTYGPGSSNYYQALQDNDALLGELIAELKKKDSYSQTDIIIVSDHAHSSVSGPLNQFPLRSIQANKPGVLDENGFSVSGNVRAAELLSQAGFHAYDGDTCQDSPVMTGIKADGTKLHAEQVDETGKICGKKKGARYTSTSYTIPAGKLSDDAIIVAANGGSDYCYVPSHHKALVKKLVHFLQSHSMFDAIFVDNTRYGAIDGTVSLEAIGIQNKKNRSPDVIVGFSYDAEAKINRTPGIEFSDWPNVRGNHGSFSPVDVHNFLAANGPDFRPHFQDHLPTGNVDVAPTIAYLLGLNFKSEGRVLREALLNVKQAGAYKVNFMTVEAPRKAQDIKMVNILNEPLATKSYKTVVYTKMLIDGDKKYLYFDAAKGVRQ